MSTEYEVLKLLDNTLKKYKDMRISMGNFDVLGKDLDPTQLLNIMKDWSILSQQGLLCGILGCNVICDEQCKICNAYYCSPHIKFHFHSDDNPGVFEA